MQTFQRDGAVRQVNTVEEAVALRFAGWVEVAPTAPGDEPTEPEAAPDSPASAKKATPRKRTNQSTHQ